MSTVTEPVLQAETETVKECRRCDKALDTTGYPLWCQSCRSKHRKEYNATVKDMTESRGFAAGVSAMRQLLADELRRRGPGMYSARDLYNWVKLCKGPDSTA